MNTIVSRPDPVFVANEVWLDFVNTELAERGERIDLLDGFSALADWFAQARLLESSQREAICKRWGETPAGERIVREAVSLREVLRELARRIVEGGSVPPGSVEAINSVLRTRPAYPQLVKGEDGYAWRTEAEAEEPMHLLVPIAHAAGEFLVQGDPSLVRRCDHPACILYFYDTTKNHSRRFCSPDTCGNRAKAAARYRRVRQQSRESR